MFASHCSAASLSLCAAGFKVVSRRSFGRKRPYRFDGCGETNAPSGDLRRNNRSFFDF
jgi:tRNA U34 5-methylaminomethyl-2-thiouridine-forming methyltransferase MnmC